MTHPSILLQNGHLLCPQSGLDQTGDLLIKQGHVQALGKDIPSLPADIIKFDCSGCLVAPGLIDMHVHLREPGQEYKETIASGSKAAAAGGFTAVCAMPNTKPVNDSRAVTEYILEKAGDVGLAKVYPIGAITKGLQGETLSEMAELKDAGCLAVSDDGFPVSNARLFRRALEYAQGLNLLTICHSEDLSLSKGGAMHEGPTSTRLGLYGIPDMAEVICVERDINLAELTGARMHIAHVSCAKSLQAIARAKDKGLKISCETAPHYLTLIDEDINNYDTNRKMSPPLRSSEDRAALREAVASGLIDIIATDHAPHSILEKEVEFDQAANGVIGLETSVGIMLQLVKEGVLTLKQMIERMSTAPARILGIDGGEIKVGAKADITVINPRCPWQVDPFKMSSLSQNTPFAGWTLPGRAALTIMNGSITYNLKELGD